MCLSRGTPQDGEEARSSKSNICHDRYVPEFQKLLGAALKKATVPARSFVIRQFVIKQHLMQLRLNASLQRPHFPYYLLRQNFVKVKGTKTNAFENRCIHARVMKAKRDHCR